jgi:lipoprotein-anchoring transpeptidase ErfK/SrfK
MRNTSWTVQGTYILLAALTLAPGIVGAQSHIERRSQHRAAHPAESAANDPRMLATQVALDRAGFSPGEIDGHGGSKTRLALAAYRASASAPLDVPVNPLTTYTITEQDAAGPFIDSVPRDMMEQAKLPALSYTSPLEALGEKFHSSPNLLRRVNPTSSWKAGETIKVPDVQPFELPARQRERSAAGRAGRGRAGAPSAATLARDTTGPVEVVVTGETKSLTVRDSAGKTLMYAPVTTGSTHDPLPIGEWKVVGVAWNPVFNYNPDLFWDAAPTQAKAQIPAGPNNPVGVVWIDINKEHFGLHGTPEPSTIGRTESHGCIRLTNWDAARLARLVSRGTKVILQ